MKYVKLTTRGLTTETASVCKVNVKVAVGIIKNFSLLWLNALLAGFLLGF